MQIEPLSLPEIPNYSDEELIQLAENRKFGSVSFETLRACAMAVRVSHAVQEDKEFVIKQKSLKYRVAIGHISKITNLVFGILKLGHDDEYGTSVELLANQIYKIAVQCMWIIDGDGRDNLYINKSLSFFKKGVENLNNIEDEGQRKHLKDYSEYVLRKMDIDSNEFSATKETIPGILKMLEDLNDEILIKLYNLTYNTSNTTYQNIIEDGYLMKKDEIYYPSGERILARPFFFFLPSLVILKLLEKFCNHFYSEGLAKQEIQSHLSDGVISVKKMLKFSIFSRVSSFLDKAKSNKGSSSNKLQRTQISDISSHKREKKKLIPPFMQAKNITTQSWMNDRFPDTLWIAMLFVEMGREETFRLFSNLTNYFQSRKDLQGDITFTGIAGLDETTQKEVMKIVLTEESKKIFKHLHIVDSIPSKDIWIPSKNDLPDYDRAWQFLGKCISSRNKEDIISVDCMYLKLICKAVTGKMVFSDKVKSIVEELRKYPNNPNPEEMFPRIRSMEGIFSKLEESSDRRWINTFWKEFYQNSQCFPNIPIISKFKAGYSALNERNLEKLYEEIGGIYLESLPNTGVEAKHDTLFGVALFIIKLAQEIIQKNKDNILGVMGIRTIAEAIINLKYLLFKNEKELWQKYRDYGTGQAKLIFLKNYKDKKPPHYLPIDNFERIAEEDKWGELVPVDLGDWSGEGLRKRSISSKTEDIYNDYYHWPSCLSHAHWNAIRYTVFDTCINPTHRQHRIPKFYSIKFKTVEYDLGVLVNILISTLNDKLATKSLSQNP